MSKKSYKLSRLEKRFPGINSIGNISKLAKKVLKKLAKYNVAIFEPNKSEEQQTVRAELNSLAEQFDYMVVRNHENGVILVATDTDKFVVKKVSKSEKTLAV